MEHVLDIALAALLFYFTLPRPSLERITQLLHWLAASGRKCELTGKKANNGYTVTFSHIRNKKLQQVNLHRKRVFWPEGKRWVRLRISAQVRSLPFEIYPWRQAWTVASNALPQHTKV